MPNKKKQRKLSCPKQSSGIVDKPMNLHQVPLFTLNKTIRKTDKANHTHLATSIYGHPPLEFQQIYGS
tara:strand:+ start:1042 stop:1245 length:204 start_codon:yes stop_codon:yes gene_type:complete